MKETSDENKIDAEAQAAREIVLPFVPKKFPLSISDVATKYVQTEQDKKKQFLVSPLVAEQAGIAELHRRQIEARVEEQALERLKEIEERAYAEAFQLGLIEGREKAYSETKAGLEEGLQKWEGVLSELARLRSDLIVINEKWLVKLVYLIAKKIALRDIEENPLHIISLLNQMVEESQSEETVTVHVSPADYEFLHAEGGERLAEAREIKDRIRIVADNSLGRGSCQLKSNYGTIDAELDQRLERAWELMADRLPHLQASPPQGGQGE